MMRTLLKSCAGAAMAAAGPAIAFPEVPELRWRYGYALVLMVMLFVALLQAWLLARRGWFQDWTTPR